MPARTTALTAGEDREVIRLAAPVALWWVWLVFVAANVADFAIQGLSSARFGAVISAVLLFVTGLFYTLALRPRVVTDPASLTVVNPYRTHRVPWPLVQSVDTGDWVRVQYSLPVTDSGGQPTKTLYCWALYISSRAKRKIARGPRPQRRSPFGWGAFSRTSAEIAYAPASSDSSKMPDEARHLASMPVAQAIATRLDTRAARERARRPAGGPDQQQEQATASWSVPALAAAVIPALVLLVVALI
jgi:hypothetical protein